ncbi:hypothetical protein PVK06_033398 [Gossypium arboreum]|uniref:Uncharacterized protein n=1 Tax=Gossypium arboreum TaxID=29729 RepID=A0ABR0NBU9_GOSAR|nr:hypothetical protein PVK06_033398 [Gossypium arboreum]
MGISSTLMGSSVVINVPSPPSSSSSSSGAHRTVENDGEDRVGREVEARLSDRNRLRRRLGHEVPRLILDNVENDKMLMSLNRGIEELNKGENQLNLEIEELERKVVMLMLAKGLKGDKLDKSGERKGVEVLKAVKLNYKWKDLGIGTEEHEKCGKGKVLKTDPARQKMNPRKLIPNKKEIAQEKGNVVGEAVNMNDDGDKEEKKLSKEIELLEAMLERGSYGLTDLQVMMEEVKAMKGSEKMVNEIEVKMTELETELWELKNAIVELKGKKSKELMGRVKKEEDKEVKREEQEQVQQEDDDDDDDDDDESNTSKINWGSVISAVGAAAVATAAVFFMGGRVVVKSEKRNKRQNI